MPWNTDTFYEHSELLQSCKVGMLYINTSTEELSTIYIVILTTTEY